MGTSDAFDKVTAFGKYHAQGVIDALQIPEEDVYARQAVKFVFKVMADECRNPHISQTENNRWASDLTYDKIQKRYELYRLYAPLFFPDDCVVDHPALVTAIICDEYIVHANEPIQNPDNNEEHIVRDDGFDEDVLLRASILFDDALNFDIENPPDISTPELGFLVHVNEFQHLEGLEDSMPACTSRELDTMRHQDLDRACMVAWTWTELGNDIKKYAQRLAREIDGILNPPPPPKTWRPSIVPPT